MTASLKIERFLWVTNAIPEEQYQMTAVADPHQEQYVLNCSELVEVSATLTLRLHAATSYSSPGENRRYCTQWCLL